MFYRYILGAFVGLSFAQNMIWNTWGPIADSAKFVFGWSDSTIAWMSNWGPISFIVSGAFFSWLLSKSTYLHTIVYSTKGTCPCIFSTSRCVVIVIHICISCLYTLCLYKPEHTHVYTCMVFLRLASLIKVFAGQSSSQL